jgi:hypothetical protein
MSVTPVLFAETLLSRLGMPVTDNNVTALVAVQAIEGGHQANSAWHNPLNTMRSMPGASDAGLQVKGIKAYSNWDDGVEATALTIEQGTKTHVAPGFDMSDIYRSLARSAPPDETVLTWQSSHWGWDKAVKVAPAASFKFYRNVVYRGAGFLSAHGRAFKYGAMTVVGVLALGGLVLVGIGIKKKRDERRIAWAQS